MKASWSVTAPADGYQVKARGLIVWSGRPWVAEIVGETSRGGLERRFLKPKIDIRKSENRAMTRGVTWWWVLESGRLYEASERDMSRPSARERRRFLRVAGNGDVVVASWAEVCEWLANEASASMS